MKQVSTVLIVAALLSASPLFAQDEALPPPDAAAPQDEALPPPDAAAPQATEPTSPDAAAPQDEALPPPAEAAPQATEPTSPADAVAAPTREPGGLQPLGAGAAGDGGPMSYSRPSFGGLTGYGELITPEVVRGHLDEELKLGVRANFFFQTAERQFEAGPADVEVRAQSYVFQAAVGLMDMAEFSLSLPLVDYELSSNIPGVRDQDAGFGNPELGAKFKLPIELEFVSAAAYTRVQLPWGEHGVFRPTRFPAEEGDFVEWELGGVVGLSAGMLSGTMNLAFRLIEEGTQTFRYRFGLAIRPIETFELGLYYAGEEFEGSAGSDGVFGATATMLFKPLFVQMGVEGLIIDNASDEFLPGAGSDAGGWVFTLGAGATF